MFGAGRDVAPANALLFSSLLHGAVSQAVSATPSPPSHTMSPAADRATPPSAFFAVHPDILRLTQDTNGVHLSDDAVDERPNGVGVSSDEQPLDLSTKKRDPCTPEPSPSPRASVIRTSLCKYSDCVPTASSAPRGGGVKRSTSSVSYRSTPEPDVSEHFRRSLSGKWPRRQCSQSFNGDCDQPSTSRKISASSTPSLLRSPIVGRKGNPPRVSQIIINEGQVGEGAESAANIYRHWIEDGTAEGDGDAGRPPPPCRVSIEVSDENGAKKDKEARPELEKSPSQELRALTVAEASRLTPKKCDILTETYGQLKHHLVHNIQTLFIRLFSEYPSYKDIWPQFRAIPDSSLMYSNELKKHVHVYSKGMTSIINALNTQKELYMILRKLAKAHARKNVYKNHIMHMLPEYLAVLRSAGVEMTDEVKEAWTTLFDVMGNLVDPLKSENLNQA